MNNNSAVISGLPSHRRLSAWNMRCAGRNPLLVNGTLMFIEIWFIPNYESSAESDS
jgi:hypothetical protein